MNFMNCNTCQRVVQINNTGICLGCQRGFTGMDAEDVYKPPILDAACKQDTRTIEELEARQKKIEQELDEKKPGSNKPKRRKQ